MRRLVALLSAGVLVASLAASSTAAATSSKNMFVGNFEAIDFGTGLVIGRVTADLVEPTDRRLVAGTYDFTGAPGFGVLAGHGQLAIGRFGYEPNARPGVSGANFAEGTGVECDYYAPNRAICREWLIQFLDFVEPGIPSQIDVATRDPISGEWSGWTSYEVGKGAFVLTYAGG
jgi:hypothetical protein